ncbi:MAG TPA: signal peptidase I [Myxococcaceae bacterium]|jgi:signal peptidase I
MSDSSESAPASAGPDERLSAVLLQRRDGDLQKLHRRVSLQDRITSLWMPVVAFLACFVPYVVVVELWPGSASWAQPAIKTAGLLLVVWYFASLAYRMSRPAFRELRKARVAAEELLLQIERELQRRGVEKATREKILDQSVAVDRSRAGAEAKKIQADSDRLTGLADKYLEGWRARSSVAGLRGLLLTLLGVAVLRTVVVEPFKIPSGSMIPTLEIGDHVVVNRFIYGVRIPWANVVPFVIVRRPRPGDVVVFNNPREESVDFIKRVIAVPGDEVQQIDEAIWVNGKQLPRDLVKPDEDVWTLEKNGQWFHQTAERYEEQGPFKSYPVLQGPNRHTRGQTSEKWKVPENSVMVLGDDRDNSSDSRYGFAVDPPVVSYVPYGHIKGKAMVVWLSLCHEGLGSGLPFWPFDGSGLCPGRMFTPVR